MAAQRHPDYRALHDEVEELLAAGQHRLAIDRLHAVVDHIAIDYPDRHAEAAALVESADREYLDYLNGETDLPFPRHRQLLLLMEDLGWRDKEPVTHNPLDLLLGGTLPQPTIMREGNLNRPRKQATPSVSGRVLAVVALVLFIIAGIQMLRTLHRYGYLGVERTESPAGVSLT